MVYIEKYWERCEDWCMAYRDETTHGNQTNNFCEVSIRLFKDVVLSRNKAYNAVALIDFIVSCLEEYYQKRIRNFANSRNSTPRLLLKKLIHKASNINRDDILCTGSKTYKVPSATKNGEHYYIDGNIGVCTCHDGRLGKFCKHQAAVYFYFDETVINAPAVTPESRYEMAKLAFGEKVQPISFYMPLVLSDTSSKHTEQIADINVNLDGRNELISIEIGAATSPTNFVNSVALDDRKGIEEIYLLMQQHNKRFGTSNATIQKCIQRL